MSIMAKLKKKLYFVVAGYFRWFANFSLRRWRPRVVAITGSAGKTTMLHLLEYHLGKEAHYSHNANSAFGIAFDVLGLTGVSGSKWRWLWLFVMAPIRAMKFNYREKFYVVEIDGERPHEAEFLAKWLKPEVTLWVSLGLSHARQFDEVVKKGRFANLAEAIAYEFASLARYTNKMVLIDAESDLMRQNVAKIKAEVVAVERKKLKKYEVSPFETKFGIGEKVFRFGHAEPRDIAVQLLMLDELMRYLGREVKTDLTEMKMPAGRSAVFEGIKETVLIDSTYNAHIISMQSVLMMMKEMKVKKKWLVIGDIVEQGSIEAKEHKKLGEIIAEAGAQKVILVGRRTKKYTAEVLKKKKVDFVALDDVKQALAEIKKNIEGGEVIAFKGSQYLEWVVEQLLLNSEEAKNLARREVAAAKRRQKWGLE